MTAADDFAIALHADDGTLIVGIRPDGSIVQGPNYQPDRAAREFWEAVTRAARSAAPWAEQGPSPITAAMVRAAAEAMEDECLRRLGRDLGTVHRDDIARAGLEAAARAGGSRD